MAELDATEAIGILHKPRSRDELQLLTHLLFDLMLLHLRSPTHLLGLGLHLRSPTHLLGLCLSGETLLISAVDGIANIIIILGDNQRLLRQE